MARALRPVVLLMLLASVLFVVDGYLDGVYPGGPAWFTGKYDNVAVTSYLFAVLNALVAVLIARGSERGLIARMVLSVTFLIERPATAFVLGPKPGASVVVHFLTAAVELVILLSALRVLRLGRSVASSDLERLLALDAPTATPAAATPPEREELVVAPKPPRALRGRTSWLLGILTLLLAAAFVADGAISGFVPGGRSWGLVGDASGWLVYLFAVVVLTVSTRAVHGGHLALRLLFALSLIFFVERAFSPFALKVLDPVALGLHGLTAFISLALALATASAIRAGPLGETASDLGSLEAA